VLVAIARTSEPYLASTRTIITAAERFRAGPVEDEPVTFGPARLGRRSVTPSDSGGEITCHRTITLHTEIIRP
jgi:hypothetical protein